MQSANGSGAFSPFYMTTALLIYTTSKKIADEVIKKVPELILPDLNLKTATVLNLFEDVNYDLNTVRYEKKVKPIYFTQFPKDLDEIQSVKLKKETLVSSAAVL